MELDDLKKSWQQSNQQARLPDRDIRELIHNRSNGPVAQLKRRFKRGMFIIVVVAASLVMESKGFYHGRQVLLWYMLSFCLFMLLYFYFNYRLVSKMQGSGESVKGNLERQVRLLKNGLKWRLLITRTMIVLYMLILEWIMYLHPGQFPKWHMQSLPVRSAVYAAVFALLFVISKLGTDRRYKKQMAYLENLAAQLQE